MAKKKNTPTFNPGGFRAAEEASMASFPKAQKPVTVDERTQLAAKGVIPKPAEQKDSKGLYYNYFTGEYVSSPDLIKPRTGMGGAESGGGSILVTPEDYKAAGLTPPGSPSGKTVVSVTYEGTGKARVKVTKYSDGTETREPAPEGDGNTGGGKKLVSTYKDPVTGDIIAVYDDGTTAVLVAGNLAGDKQRAGQSAFDLLKDQFNRFGLGALVDDVSQYIKDGLSADELLIRLRTESKAYKTRFGANDQRIAKGLRALSEAEYIGLEDQYQNVMRNYGLPESYYKRGDLGRQEGFEKFIAGDVSAAELEDRIQTAQNRVINANPEVTTALKQFYPDITNGDILAYALNPDKALTDIKRKVTAAEIGGAALTSGLATDLARAEQLRAYGVTGQQAKEGYQAIAGVLPRATTLADIYAKQGLGKYEQATAEAEVFGTPGSAEAAQKRKKLTELEQAQFSGSVGRAGSALSRERAGQF